MHKYLQNLKLTREASQRQLHFQVRTQKPERDPAARFSSVLWWQPLSSSGNIGVTCSKKKKKIPERHRHLLDLQAEQVAKCTRNESCILRWALFSAVGKGFPEKSLVKKQNNDVFAGEREVKFIFRPRE